MVYDKSVLHSCHLQAQMPAQECAILIVYVSFSPGQLARMLNTTDIYGYYAFCALGNTYWEMSMEYMQVYNFIHGGKFSPGNFVDKFGLLELCEIFLHSSHRTHDMIFNFT